MTEIILDKDEDWEKRILCVDESCIGTIGHDGRCRECGKPHDGTINSASAVNEINQEKAESSASDDDWEKRVLCSDETCIGTIAPDGRCRECGKPGNE